VSIVVNNHSPVPACPSPWANIRN